ncbi:hypothetical protein EJB05_26159, partial [Eragrostis curvula]
MPVNTFRDTSSCSSFVSSEICSGSAPTSAFPLMSTTDKATGDRGEPGFTSLDHGEESRLLVGGQEFIAEPQPPDLRHRIPPPPLPAAPAPARGADPVGASNSLSDESPKASIRAARR